MWSPRNHIGWKKILGYREKIFSCYVFYSLIWLKQMIMKTVRGPLFRCCVKFKKLVACVKACPRLRCGVKGTEDHSLHHVPPQQLWIIIAGKAWSPANPGTDTSIRASFLKLTFQTVEWMIDMRTARDGSVLAKGVTVFALGAETASRHDLSCSPF